MEALTGPVPVAHETPLGYTPAVSPIDMTAKSKLVAGLLGIFLGGFGIHRFYLGYQNIGIAQLLLNLAGVVLIPFTCGLGVVACAAAWVWGLVDAILILTGSLRTDAQGHPLRD